MATPIAPPGMPAGVVRVFDALGDALRSMMSIADLLDGFLVAQRRAGRDHADLSSMSDRELADIGLPRGSVDAAAHGAWTRGPMI